MSMYFSKIVDRYFLQWIALPTWDSMHSMDMERFYQFMKAMKRYSRKHWTTRFHQSIVKAAAELHPRSSEKYIHKMADFFLQTAGTIFEYESASFPDPLVEMRNPYEVDLYLRTLRIYDSEGNAQYMYTGEEIERILEDNFGSDWRKRVKPGK